MITNFSTYMDHDKGKNKIYSLKFYPITYYFFSICIHDSTINNIWSKPQHSLDGFNGGLNNHNLHVGSYPAQIRSSLVDLEANFLYQNEGLIRKKSSKNCRF